MTAHPRSNLLVIVIASALPSDRADSEITRVSPLLHRMGHGRSELQDLNKDKEKVDKNTF